MSPNDPTPALERVRAAAAAVFRVPLHTITAMSSPSDIAAWDSVGHLNLVLALEEETGVQFDPEETLDIETIGDLAALVDRKVRSA